MDVLNPYFGSFGDVFKHLLILETLAREDAGSYWESHAGGAWYTMDASSRRRFGVLTFIELAPHDQMLRRTKYFTLLKGLSDSEGRLSRYPGSATLVAHLCGKRIRDYVLCDNVESSVDDLKRMILDLGLWKLTTCYLGDGIDFISQGVSALVDERARRTFLFIDPYSPSEPSATGYSSFDLWKLATDRGVQTALWYPLQSKEDHLQHFESAQSHTSSVWLGSVILEGVGASQRSGLPGCALMVSHLSAPTVRHLEDIGRALTDSYKSVAPSPESGTVSTFRSSTAGPTKRPDD